MASLAARLTLLDDHLKKSEATEKPGSEGPPEIVRSEVKSTIPALVVDDDYSLRESCASLLRAEGFPVTVSSGGEEALELIRHRHFEIILLDLYMRDVSGMDLLKAVMEKGRETSLILRLCCRMWWQPEKKFLRNSTNSWNLFLCSLHC